VRPSCVIGHSSCAAIVRAATRYASRKFSRIPAVAG
jgi:hypothetical protein